MVRTTKNKAVISLNNKDSLVLSFDNVGKFVNSNVMRGSKPGANYFVAGCKNTEDLILIEQECADKTSGSECTRYGRQVNKFLVVNRCINGELCNWFDKL